MSIRVLNRVLNYDHKVSSTEYLLDRMSKGYRELSIWDYLEFANLKLCHNSIRSWRRLVGRLEQYVPSVLEPEVYPPIEMGTSNYDDLDQDTQFSSDNYCRLTNHIQYFYNLIEGHGISEPTTYTLMRKDFIYDSLCKMIYLNFDELEIIYLALIDKSTEIPNSLASKLNSSFPDSVLNNRLSSYFRNNMIYLYSS